MRTLTTLSSAIAIAGLVSIAAASTFVVDSGGGGDFTTIQPAITAAQPGDLILVRPGTYPSFVLDKPLTILASPSAGVQGLSSVTGIAAGNTAALAGLRLMGLRLLDSPGTIVLDSVEVDVSWSNEPAYVNVTSCEDVRILRCRVDQASSWGYGVEGLRAAQSRLDVVESVFEGSEGAWGSASEWGCSSGKEGRVAARINGGLAHFSLSSFRGGDGGGVGGDCDDCWWPLPSLGHGAAAILVGGGFVHLSGTGAQAVTGGDGGWSWNCGSGIGASGLVLSTGSSCRYSGVLFQAGAGVGNTPPTQGGGTLTQAIPADPILALSSAVPGPGGPMRYVVYGESGDQVVLLLGTGPARVSLPGVVVEQLTTEDFRPLYLGTIGAGGNVTLLRSLPAWAAQPGRVLYAQARVMRGAEELRTNSVAFVVRE